MTYISFVSIVNILSKLTTNFGHFFPIFKQKSTDLSRIVQFVIRNNIQDENKKNFVPTRDYFTFLKNMPLI